MTSTLNLVVVVEADGMVRACPWCLHRAAIAVLNQRYIVSHSLCQPCATRFEQGESS